MARVFIGVGSNISPAENVSRAVRSVAEDFPVAGISTVYRTPAEGRPEQPDYYNCVIEIDTEVPPLELKRRLRSIEETFGRRRSADKYAARPIDLDVIMYDDLVLQTGDLTLPDPDIMSRPYLAAGLAELAPALILRLPGSEMTIEQIRNQISPPASAKMIGLIEYTEALRHDVLGGDQ